MNHKIKKSILIMTVLSATVLVAAGINYRLTQHVVERTIVAQQVDLADRAAGVVELWLSQQTKILDATAQSMDLASLGQNKTTLEPLKMAMRAGHFSDVYIGRDNGELIDGADWLPPKEYDPRQRPWYRRAMDTGQTSFTTPYIDLVTNKLVIALVTPLRRDGRTIGVMGADTVLDTLVANVLHLKVSDTGFAFLVEKSGTIIVHPRQEYVMRARLQHIEPSLAGMIRQFSTERTGATHYTGSNGQDNILSFRRIADSDWMLCITLPHAEAYALARKGTMIFTAELALRILGILALVALIGVGGSGLVLLGFSRHYSTAVQQHRQEISGISRDLEWNITKRKEVETYYQTLFNVANDAILISRGLAFTECNHKAEEMFGLSRQALLAKTMLELSPAHQADGTPSGQSLQAIVDSCRQGEQQQAFRWSFLRSDGSEFPASVSLNIFTLNGEELMLSSVRDISKRVDAEGQLIQAQKMAVAGEMLGAIAHQWRQPLNTLATYISSLEAAHYNGKLSSGFVEKLVSGAHGQIHFMSKTIDDFRNFFRPSKTKGPVDVFGAIISAVKLMEAQMKHWDIHLIVHNRTGEKSLIVLGYQGEFVHVLVNILANAKDAILENATPDDPRDKSIRITTTCADDHVLISILDSGGGIPDHLLAKIFNPYCTTKGSSAGTGMGLYMSKMIVEKEMGGELTAANTANGAEFTIKLKKMPMDDLP